MADQQNGAPPSSSGYPGSALPGTDLISLEDAQRAPLDKGAGASAQDTILNAAEIFQSQLEQMTAWKHQLAQQMELMRRDGIKLLERQKAMAIEKKRAGEEREALAAERGKIQELQKEVENESQRLKKRAAEIEQAQAQLQRLNAHKERWEAQLAEAKQEAESLTTQRALTASELAAAEVRLGEVRAIEGRRDELKKQVADAEQRLVQIEGDRRALETARHDLELQQAQLQARQKSLADQEGRCLAEDVRLKEGLEQLENLRRNLSETQRQTTHDREAVTAQQHQVAERGQTFAQQAQELVSREEAVKAGRAEMDRSQLQLQTLQRELAQREQAVANSGREAEAELKARLAQAEQFRQQAGEERQAAITLRHELQRKLDALDQEHAEQHEALAKQTKRLQERRNEIESAERDLDKALEVRIAQATSAMQAELAHARQGYEQRAAQLEQRSAQLEQRSAQVESAAQSVQTNEDALQRQLAESQAQLNKMREELTTAGTIAGRLTEENAGLAKELAAKVEEGRQAAEQWQAKLDTARNQSSDGNAALQAAHQAVVEGQKDIETLKNKILELKTARDNAEFQLEVQAEEGRKALEAVRQEMTQELARREQEMAGWKTKYELAMKSGPGKGENPKGKAAELAKQLTILEQQRNDLAEQLFAVQDSLKRYQEDTQLAKNTWQAELAAALQKSAALEAEKSKWKANRTAAAPAAGGPQAEEAQRQTAWQRERLLRRAKAVRGFRQQLVEYKATAEVGRQEIAQQREQLRSRKENLEQVKRLLEKQEMVMARKLADHNAIKTVAALGIFVIMILGSTFLGVYRFVHPVFRSEAVVRLAPDERLQGGELETWMKSQAEFMRANEVTFAAWKVLRGTDVHYGMHDVREEWLSSLAKSLTVQTDPATKTLAIRYNGPDAEGVSQVCNALAISYATPGVREITEQTRLVGQGAQILAKATVPLYPVEDNRLMISLYVSAGVLVISFFLVLLFRHFVARQLREIDQMADAQDLDEVNDEAGGAAPQAAA